MSATGEKTPTRVALEQLVYDTAEAYGATSPVHLSFDTNRQVYDAVDGFDHVYVSQLGKDAAPRTRWTKTVYTGIGVISIGTLDGPADWPECANAACDLPVAPDKQLCPLHGWLEQDSMRP